MTQGRTIRCKGACGAITTRAGSTRVPGVGYCCAGCAGTTAPAPKAAISRHELARDDRPWVPTPAAKTGLSEPAQPATGNNVHRATTSPLGRYAVAPGEVTPLFAAMGIGRYLDEVPA